MADKPTASTTPKAKKTPASPAKGGGAASAKSTKSASTKTGAVSAAPTLAADTGSNTAAAAPEALTEAKSRFNAALEEAKAGAAALRAEAENRVHAVGDQAKGKGNDLVAEAKTYGDQALAKASDLATEGKNAACDAIASLGKAVADTAPQIDEKFGHQYGDYARKASQSLAEASARLETKSVEEIGEDAREFVRKSPGTAVGIAAVFGFLLARLFRGSRD